MTTLLLARGRAARLALDPTLAGLLGGLVAALSWGGYLALMRAGVKSGLAGPDFLILRFGVAAVLTAPLLVWRWPQVRAIGPGRALALALAAGPLFVLVGSTGFAFAPLSHGAVVQPATVAVGGLILGTLLLGEAMTARKALGAGAVIAGVLLVGGAALTTGEAGAWIGDLLFAAAGGLWLVFTVLLRRWRIDPLAGAAVVNAISGAVVLPAYLLAVGPDRLAALPPGTLALQAFVQGVLAGAVAVAAFAVAVRELGAGRAALFPALVPATAVLIGIPVAGEVPGIPQVAGLVLATAGLVLAVTRGRGGPR